VQTHHAPAPEGFEQRLLAIEYLEEEVFIVGVSLACPPERLDRAVGPFDSAAADMVAGIGDDPLHRCAHVLLLRAQVGLKEHLIRDCRRR